MKQENSTGELVLHQESGPMIPAPQPQNPIQPIINELIRTGVTPENAAALERVCNLYKDMNAFEAKKAFAVAKAALQAELPNVMATKAIPGKDGHIRSVFAPYEEIMATVGPHLVKHGFSVSFTIRVDDGGKRLCAVCNLSHIGGHGEANEFSVRVGSGPPGCSEAQADGAARSYARRGALCDALNIIVDKDTDARLEGAAISADEARELQEGVRRAGLHEATFLKLAAANSFATIREGKLPILRKVIAEAVRREPAGSPAESPSGLAAAKQVLIADVTKLRFDLGIGEGKDALATPEFLRKVARLVLGKKTADSLADVDAMRAAILERREYDLETGDRIPEQ